MSQSYTDEKNMEAERPILSESAQDTAINWRLVWVLSLACAMTAANLYYSQPLLASIAQSFSASERAVGFIATLTQLGFAFGLLFIVPLGDAFERRKLLSFVLLAVTVSLVATAFSPTLLFLALASFAVGVTTVVPHLIVPFAASLARPHERGRVVGTVMSSLLIGILLARTISGVVGAFFGWRAMYWIAAAMMIGLLLILRAILPREHARMEMSYAQLLRSLWGFVKRERVLREASVLGGLVFGAFSVFWVALPFLLITPPYHFNSAVVGLFGLVGVAGALSASYAGKLADRINARITTGVMLGITLLSFLCFWLLGLWLVGLIIGVILLDLGTQAVHISNQTRVFSLNAEARSRLNTVYMVTYFVGGSLGSFLGAYGWSIARWNGVCVVGVGLLVLALAIYGIGSIRKA